jgi:Spy/CpxP family protein refolding chaperone
MRFRHFASLVAVGALVALPALAGRPHGPGPGGPGPGGLDPERLDAFLEMRAERLAEALDLSADQRANFERLRGEMRASAEPSRERMRTVGEELRALLDADAPDAAQVGAKVIEMHRLRGELRAAREKLERDFEATLSEAQKLAWSAVKETRPGRHLRGRMGGGPGDGPFGGPFGGPPDVD